MNRFENVDVLAALEQLMRQNTAFYRNDFEIDKEIIGRAAASDKAEDKTLLWMSRPSGTHCFRESDVYLQGTAQHNTWKFYGEQPAGLYFDGRPDPKLGAFLRYEAKPNEPEHLRELLRQEQKGRAQLAPGDFKAHVTALHDGMILAEAQRIVAELKTLPAPNSPNKTHFMVELSPYFVQIASSKDTDRLFSMLPYKSLCFTGMKDRHGLYAVIGKDENRDKEARRPRASIRRQLSETKQAQTPKKPPARTKKNELEV